MMSVDVPRFFSLEIAGSAKTANKAMLAGTSDCDLNLTEAEVDNINRLHDSCLQIKMGNETNIKTVADMFTKYGDV